MRLTFDQITNPHGRSCPFLQSHFAPGVKEEPEAGAVVAVMAVSVTLSKPDNQDE
jgi:hypothetical protein